jgi:3D (Asp-Asp-Asp) domain-containing protein
MIILIISFSQAKEKTEKYYYMTSTGYTIHPNCTPNLKGITATNTKVHWGVVAINVDWINAKWIIKSPLGLRHKIYIEGLGYFIVEDTGSFTESNFHFDYWNLDIYFEDYDKAKKWGIKLVKVIILETGE